MELLNRDCQRQLLFLLAEQLSPVLTRKLSRSLGVNVSRSALQCLH